MKPSKNKKLVQLDKKTWIEVSEDIPDKVAVAKFNENINAARNSNSNPGIRCWGNKKKA